MSRKKTLILLAAALAAAILIYLLARSPDPNANANANANANEGPPSPAAAAPTPAPAASAPHARRIPPEARAALTAAIRAARDRRSAPPRAHATGSSSATPAPALPPGTLDKEYIRTAVRELLPLVRECYEAALAQRPGLAGTAVVRFTIEGEPEVGGVITSSDIVDDGTDIRDPDFRECVQETMYAIEIDPPEGGGVVEVRYPFSFSSGE